jgi:glycyl-tRNA synthetase beta chain
VEVGAAWRGAERTLFDQVTALASRVETDLADLSTTPVRSSDWRPAAPVDRFFDEVMVMAEEPLVRANRLGLLHTLGRLTNSVADIGQLAVR